MLTNDNLERYSRSILLNEIDISGQMGICSASVVVVGCGGLASFVLPVLVASGIKKLTIIDFDTIELSNLPRQVMFCKSDIGKHKVSVAVEYLQKLNEECKIEGIIANHEVLSSVIQNHDAILDLTDSAESRYYSNKVSLLYKKPFFTGSVQGFAGHVYSFGNHLEGLPCYECLFPQENGKNPIITCANAGVFSPVVQVVGGVVACNVLKHFAGLTIDFTDFLFIDLLSKIRLIKMSKDFACQCCRA